MKQTILALILLALPLSACAPVTDVTRAAPETLALSAAAPPNAEPGQCWDTHTTPAVVETVTEQILLHPAEIATDGTVRSPSVYKTETRQAIVRERRELWFETPCASDMTPDFIASLQRALTVRGQYRGPITGTMDARTRRAVRAYQAPQGLDSTILSLAAARQMGLVEVTRSNS